ncbi:calcium-binding protein [Pseudaestuariivita rosea]|uniref:calcium-binding protein n=1 Tax=Pseudaestuariivita rosea TaxID=2763263 RepID=UPI001ABB97AB|nr:calcium-binding protein [Pseudaestuariivita rosea]
MADGVQVHHILPTAVYDEFKDIIDRWTKSGSNVPYVQNAAYNLVLLPTTVEGAEAMKLPKHLGSHPWLNNAWRNIIEDIDSSDASDIQKAQQFKAAHSFFRGALDYSNPDNPQTEFKTFIGREDPAAKAFFGDTPTTEQMHEHYRQQFSPEKIRQSDAFKTALNGDSTNGAYGAGNQDTVEIKSTADESFSQALKKHIGFESTNSETGEYTKLPNRGSLAEVPGPQRLVHELTNRLNDGFDPNNPTSGTVDFSDTTSRFSSFLDSFSNNLGRISPDAAAAIDADVFRADFGSLTNALNNYLGRMANAVSAVEFEALSNNLVNGIKNAYGSFQDAMTSIPGGRYLAFGGTVADIGQLGFAAVKAQGQWADGDVDGALQTMANASTAIVISFAASVVVGTVAAAFTLPAAVIIGVALIAGVAAGFAWDYYTKFNPDWLSDIPTLADILGEGPPIDPLVIDLDGDGLELISLNASEAYFDLDGDGFAERTGWVSPDDALLAIDRNGNGQIDDITEVFGSEDRTGYEELGDFDINGDGVINANDAIFSELLLWQDTDGDGRSEAVELSSLQEAGIAEISLNVSEVNQTVEGNDVIETAEVVFEDGTTTQSWEVLFNLSQIESTINLSDDYEYNSDVFTMPFLRGSGTISDLWVSMTENAELAQQARDVISLARNGNYNDFTTNFDAFLASWAGTDDVIWLEEVENFYVDFIYDRETIFQIMAEVGPDIIGLNGEGTHYDGPAPTVLGFAFYIGGPESLDRVEVNELLTELDGVFPRDYVERPSYWRFPISTADLSGPSVGVGSSSGPQTMRVDRFEVLGEGEVNEPPAMDASAFAFMQLATGFNFRRAENFIAPENVVVARPEEDEIDALMSTYNSIRDYNAARYLVQSAWSIIAEEGEDADLGGLAPFQHLYFNPFTDDISGASNKFAEDFINLYRSEGYGTDSEALDILGMFKTDIPELGALVAAAFKDIDRARIEEVFDITIAHEGTATDDTINITEAGVVLGHEGNDVITGGTEESTIMGGLGDDMLYGNRGRDTYIYRLGDGNDVIEDNEIGHDRTDKLHLVDLNPADLTLSRNGNDLILTLPDGGTITLKNQLWVFRGGSEDTIELFEFADGTVLTEENMRNMLVEQMKATGEAIGTGLSETYVHSMGDGSYIINDTAIHRNSDKLVFTDVVLEDLGLTRFGNDLIITLPNSETITLKDQLDYDGVHDIERFEFADGTVFTEADMRNLLVEQMKASGEVVGTARSEIYEHTLGDGSYTISDYTIFNDADKLVFTDVALEDISLARDGVDMILTLPNGESITLLGQLNPNAFRHIASHIEQFEFADGSLLTSEGLRNMLMDQMKATGAVVGTRLDETYTHSLGDGSYTISDYTIFSSNDVLIFNDLYATDVSFAINDQSDLVITTPNGDVVTILGHFVANNHSTMERIEFANGWTLNLDSILEKTTRDSDGTGNNTPQLTNDALTLNKGINGQINLLDNDSDPDGDTLMVTHVAGQRVSENGTVSLASGATVTLLAGGMLQFDQNGAYDGLDYGETIIESITYGVSDHLGAWSTATANITVGAFTGLSLNGTADADSLTGTAANDTVLGFAGNDTVLGESGDDSISGGEGNDALWAGDGDDTVDGGVGNDTLLGGDGHDQMYAGDGNDELRGWDGNDTLFGGLGDDDLRGEGGNDSIVGGAGADVMQGNAGNDDLIGDSGMDTIYSGDGDDNAAGGDDADEIWGGQGRDTMWGGQGNDIVYGGLGEDRLYGGAGHDSLNGNEGNDSITGDAGNDILIGYDGNDTLLGGDGSDQLWGETGNDILSGGLGDDILGGGDGSDQLWGNAGNDTIYAGATGDDDTLGGGDGDDQLFGSSGHNVIYLGAGHDLVNAGDGNDIIHAWVGSDTMTGGAGNDTFIFSGGISSITDFGTGDDVISLSGLSGIDDYQDLITNHLSETVNGVVIDNLAGATLTLEGLTLDDLMENDFAF